MNLHRVAAFALLFLTALAGTAAAAVPGDIVRDFKPISGYVIMPVQGEFLIDLDAGKGVAVGDLFSVVKPGEKIVHPVTKEVLGTLDEVKGLLQVSRVKSGYSYGRPLGEAKGIERGDVVRRFENVSATFWDYTGQGEAFATELSAALPNLAWTDYAAAQAARPQVPAAPGKGGSDLLFILRHDGLEVRDAAFQALHAYPSPVSAETAAPVPVPSSVAAAPVPVPVPAPSGSLEARLQALEQQAAQQQAGQPSGAAAPYTLESSAAKTAGGMAYEVAFPGFVNLGNLPGITKMADFITDNGQLYMAATDGSEIAVFTVAEGVTRVAGGDTSYVAQILSVQWWQPEQNGPLYLVATAWNDVRVVSALFRLERNELKTVQELIPFSLGTFDRDGDGRKELLLGQGYDRSAFFDVAIREGRLDGKALSFSPTKFDLPHRFTVPGSTFADVTGDGSPETIFIRHNILYVYQGEKEIYQSPKSMGGSISVAVFETNPGARESIPEYASFEVPPFAVDLDRDGVKEILSVASARPLMTAPGIGTMTKESWLAVVKFRDNMFVKGTVGERLEIPLQGLTAQPERVLFVASEPANLLGQGGGSHLLAFPLAK